VRKEAKNEVLMTTRQKAPGDPSRLCAALNTHLEKLLADGTLTCGRLNAATFVEQAGAIIYQLMLRNSDEECWLYFRIAVQSRQQANHLVAHRIAPMMEELRSGYPILDWWWLNKSDVCGSALRLRINTGDARIDSGDEIEKRLCDLGCHVSRLLYEPELCLFGGPAGLKLAHAHFCFESEFLARWMRHGDESGRALPEGLSLAMILRTLRAAGLDVFECWDVFDRLCHKRPHSGSANVPAGIQIMVHKIMDAGPHRVFKLYDAEKARMLQEYGERLDSFGQNLTRAYMAGHLECGLREFLTPLVLFHWNRAGFSPVLQAVLSWAMAKELRELSRKPATRNRQEENHGITIA